MSINVTRETGTKIETLQLVAGSGISILEESTSVSISATSGSGDMTKAVYDPDADGDIAEAQLQLNFPTHSNATDHAANADTDLDATFEASLKNTDNHTSGTTNKVFTATEQTKLAGIAAGAEVNVNADWNAVSGDAQILNKPSTMTPTSHGNEAHSSTLITASGVTYENLSANSDIGTGATQVAQGNHTHAGGSITTLKTTSDQTINGGAATFVDITGLTFAVTSGVDYAFHFYITFRSAQATTGWKSGVNHPGGTLDFWAKSDVIANGAAGVATHTERHNVAVDDMTLLTSTVTAGVDLSIIIEGRYKCTSNGTFAARFANELASNTDLVVQKGSWGWYF